MLVLKKRLPSRESLFFTGPYGPLRRSSISSTLAIDGKPMNMSPDSVDLTRLSNPWNTIGDNLRSAQYGLIALAIGLTTIVVLGRYAAMTRRPEAIVGAMVCGAITFAVARALHVNLAFVERMLDTRARNRWSELYPNWSARERLVAERIEYTRPERRFSRVYLRVTRCLAPHEPSPPVTMRNEGGESIR